MLLRFLLLALAALVVPRPLPGPHPGSASGTPATQETADRGPEPDEHPFAWLAGTWVGEGLGGQIEETWSAPRGGVMVGMFQHLVADRPNFYELFTIGVERGEWVMRLRHFDPDLSGWEEKDACLLWDCTLREPGRAGFGPVLYEREGDDQLRVSVELDRGEGGSTEEFVLRRAR